MCGKQGFLFVINHEAPAADTVVRLADLGFEIGQIVDLADDKSISFDKKQDVVQLALTAPLGRTRILQVSGK